MSNKARNEHSDTEEGFTGYLVAIGASAGGLEALEQFFRHCPQDTGAAFVVIQHLSPDHKSIMKDLLARYTQMPITVAEEGMVLLSNQVYLIPPGMIMTVESDRLHLSSKSPHGLTLPIDIFFKSVATAYENRSVGVILSGTGSDGTRGAVAINAAGGFLVAQDPAAAKFDGMPKSVLSTGVVDAVLPADQLPARILRHIQNPAASADGRKAGRGGPSPVEDEDAMEGVMQMLLQSGGIDFRDYKIATFLRRVERRMQVRQVGSVNDYLQMLQEDTTELVTLRRELLIPVTSFFRDTEAFEEMASKVIPEIVANSSSGAMIRVWTAGTSTGEEAYSLAMLFLEEFDRRRRWPTLKIFATDVNQQAIEFAGAGQYTQAVAAELSPQRLERFFNKTGTSYTVKPELRQCIVFARHNLLTDPPFTRMDLVTCRNTLIYFKPEAQTRALHRLQYAARPGGFLFLGSSESISGVSKGFEDLSPRFKIYRRNTTSLPFVIEGGGGKPGGYVPPELRQHVQGSRGPRSGNREVPALDEATMVLLSQYAPPSILVNDSHEAVHLFGDVQPFFRVRSGAVSMQVGRILPEPLVPVAQALLFKAAKDWKVLQSDFILVPSEQDADRRVRLTVRPVIVNADERFLLLCFENPQTQRHEDAGYAAPIDVSAETTARVEALQSELAATRESLQATIEELETSNEELQATNEELMASNEELQSANEELQSVNEELNTVNAEYQEKVLLLNRLNVDLDTMAKAVGVATVFVDENLHLTRYSPDAVAIFKLRDGDVGRPLDEVVHRLRHPDLTGEFAYTLQSERTVEKELLSEDGKTYLMRVMAYKVPSSSARGVVATFVDITSFQDAERLQSIIDALPEHIAVLEQDGTIGMVNSAWKRFAKANGDAQLVATGPGSNYLEACRQAVESGAGETAERAWRGIKLVLEGSQPVFSMVYPCHSPDEKRWFVMNVGMIKGGHEFGAVVSHNNISEWHEEQIAAASDASGEGMA
ncbi:MAG: chemotaxis protein CheB [Halothiobacillaceae bacterium]